MSIPQEREAAANAAARTGPDLLEGLLRPLVWTIRAAAALSCLIILGALGIVLYAVAMRYFLGTPINWAGEINGYLIVALVMFGIGATLLRGGHISIDLLTSSAGPRLARGLEVLADAAVLLFGLMFGWSAWQTVSFNRAFGMYSNGYMQVEMWLVQAPMIAGAAFLCLAALVRILRSLTGRAP